MLLLLLWSWPILGILALLYMIISDEKELTIGNLLVGFLFGIMGGWLFFVFVIVSDERFQKFMEIKLWSKK